MKELRSFFLFMSILLLTAFSLPTEPTKILKPGVYEIKLSASKKITVRCCIEVIKYSPCMLNAALGWGSDSLLFPTRTVFKEIKFQINDGEVRVPSSCFSDLTNPDKANLLVIEHGYRLVIEGSDGALGYEARIDFNKTQVFRRTVHDAGDPPVWEETVYHVDTTTADY